MNINFTGKSALICGSTQGIGFAIASLFAELGANVYLFARNEAALQSALQKLHNNGSQIHGYYAGDFSAPESAIASIKHSIELGAEFDILVNNTGGPKPGTALNSANEEYWAAFNMHIIASKMLTELISPAMKRNNFGRIINIISIGARQPIENLGVSNTIRGAMMSWSKTISRELAPHGITVNNLLPGHTKTGRLDALIQNRSMIENLPISEIESEMISKIPAGRFGNPSDLAYAAAFLASEYASFINGTSIPVDGAYLSCL